eukprot:SM000204S05846  [mRNA]  locus=s204:11722:15996:+ [translate_table: standard]
MQPRSHVHNQERGLTSALWRVQLEEALAGGSGRPAEDPRRIRYHDFFGDAPGPQQRRRGEKAGGGLRANGLEPSDVAQEHDDDSDVGADGEVMEAEEPAMAASDAPTSQVSKHEAREETARRRIKELEEANLSVQSWTMLGEVAAGQRAKNSALEVDLDFEHAARPPPVLTEESTLSLEDVIRTRVAQGQFDDVVRKEVAVAAPLKEAMEIDESKSKKGLSEIYEASCSWLFGPILLLTADSSVALESRIASAEYMHKTGQVPAPTSTTEAVKREAAAIFKELCGKLEALAHFHFAPKPVVTDMTVRMDVPALAIEEVAPVAVTEASLLAPEEVFAGGGGAQGGVHGSAAGTAGLEEELAPADRRRRHRKHKRQRKGALLNETPKKVAMKPPSSVEVVSRKGTGNHSTSYTKATKVFSELEERPFGIARVLMGGGWNGKQNGPRPLQIIVKNFSFLLTTFCDAATATALSTDFMQPPPCFLALIYALSSSLVIFNSLLFTTGALFMICTLFFTEYMWDVTPSSSTALMKDLACQDGDVHIPSSRHDPRDEDRDRVLHLRMDETRLEKTVAHSSVRLLYPNLDIALTPLEREELNLSKPVPLLSGLSHLPHIICCCCCGLSTASSSVSIRSLFSAPL